MNMSQAEGGGSEQQATQLRPEDVEFFIDEETQSIIAAIGNVGEKTYYELDYLTAINFACRWFELLSETDLFNHFRHTLDRNR